MIERPYWQRVLYAIWPTIYRAINEVVFFVLMVLKTAVKIAIDQIRRI